MKLSEFKAQYFPWSKEYKLRKQKEAKERLANYVNSPQYDPHYWSSKPYTPPEPLVKQAPPTVQSTGSDFLTGMVAGAVLDSVFNHPNSGTLGSDSSSSSYSSSSDSDSSSSWSDSSSSSWSSSDSDSSSSWSDSSSSSWSDSGSSSWD